MGILTKNKLETIAYSKIGYRTFSQVLNEAKTESKYLTKTSIFLSHSHDDKEYVEKVVVFLRTLGISVYVDWLDSSMPPTTSAETAEKIKKRIRDCNKFILLATNNAISSKWCNWELGFGDAHKYIDKIALFPLSENSGTWYGTEYLRIYPRIEASNYVDDYYKVIYPDGKETSITEWLTI